MKIGVLSSVTTVFTHSYVEVLSKEYEVFVINTSKALRTDSLAENKVYNLFKPSVNSLRSIIAKRIVKILRLDTHPSFIRALSIKEKQQSKLIEKKLESIITEENPDLVFSFWGISNLNYTNFLKEKFVDLPIIHDINTYPVREKIQWDEKHPQMDNDRIAFSKLDTLMYSSDLMKQYFQEQMDINEDRQDIVFYDTLSSSFSPRKRLEKLNITGDTPHLIFLGNTDFKNRTIDDIRPQLYSLADAGICVYVQEPSTGLKKHPNIKVFPSFSFEEIKKGLLAEYITQFDSILLIYNDFNDVRTNISIPTRFVLGLGAGIPVFIEKGKYLAIEDVFKDQVVTFECTQEIKEKLLSPDWNVRAKFVLSKAKNLELDFRLNALKNRINELIRNNKK